MNLLESNKNEKNRILKLHLNEQTSSSSAGAYETPMAFDGEVGVRDNNLVGVELVMSLPDEFDITKGDVGGFEKVDMETCPRCGMCHEGPCNHEEMDVESFDMDDLLTEPTDDTPSSDVIPDTLLTLFGDVNVDGDLEIELDEEPKRLKGSRKFRR